MKISKYFNIDPNILIEYIYDDSNLIGEPYNILINSRSNIRSFISSDELKPAPRGYKQTNNDGYNQLYRIDNVSNRFGKLPITSQPNKIDSDNYSFLQLRNFATSIPIRYDIIKIHIPIDWTFGDYKGFYLRVFTYNYTNDRIVELSNFFFNITDVVQNYKLEYSSPIQIINEKQWGKYVKLQIPALTKISDQRVSSATQSITTVRENSINFNLTNGEGMSKTAPIFMDFQYIQSVDTVGGNKFFNLTPKKTISVPQTPEFEKIGVKIEESIQGDFFLIYGTYNGNIAEFEQYIDDSYYNGNRYYAEFTVETFEKNVKTKTNTFIITEDFGDEIEFRPILKFTTTTAVIDVTLRLIDSVDGSFIERKSSYGMLQGGGARMGAEPNTRLGTGNGSGGAGDISKYAKSSTKINLKYAKKRDVINIKSTILPNSKSNPLSVKSILTLKKKAFSLYSSNFYFVNDNSDTIIGKIPYLGINSSLLYIYPFDNFIEIKINEIIFSDSDVEQPLNLEDYENLKMVIKTDKKDIEMNIYRDSAKNDFENGNLVFRIEEGKYLDIKKASNSGFDLFYIVGTDDQGYNKIIYSSFYLPWDSSVNIAKVETEYKEAQVVPIVVEKPPVKDNTESSNTAIDKGENKPKGNNSKPIENKSGESSFRSSWMASREAINLGLNVSNENKWSKVIPRVEKDLVIDLIGLGVLQLEKVSQKSISADKKTKSSQKSSSGYTMAFGSKPITKELIVRKSSNDQKLDLIYAYFKGLNINPVYGISVWFTNKIPKITKTKRNDRTFDITYAERSLSSYYESLQDDLNNYINSGMTNKPVFMKGKAIPLKEVELGEFLPKKENDKKVIKNKIFDLKPEKTTKDMIVSKTPISYSPTDTSTKSGKKTK
jgi:hypothetical protein